MVADELAPCVARSSAAMVLTNLSQNSLGFSTRKVNNKVKTNTSAYTQQQIAGLVVNYGISNAIVLEIPLVYH